MTQFVDILKFTKKKMKIFFLSLMSRQKKKETFGMNKFDILFRL